MKTIVLIVGTRPNFMKAAPLYNSLIKNQDRYDTQIIHTGQHWDKNMSEIFIDQLGLPKNMTILDDMSTSMSQNTQMAKIMLGLECEFNKIKPDLVIVFGDVTSTLAGALTANKMNIKLAHVESGNRSFDNTMPEEINRIIVDKLSNYLFVAEPYAIENLQNEHITKNDVLEQNVFYVGNTMIDTLYQLQQSAIDNNYYTHIGLGKQYYMLLTLHRQSNVDDTNILTKIINELKYLEYKIIFPVHPRQKNKIYQLINDLDAANIMLIDPLGYLEFINLMINSKLVLTDSGGVQEETTALNIPCVTLRPNTERPITLTHGTNKLVSNILKLENVIDTIITHTILQKPQIKYWDGHASERIVEIINNVIFSP